MKKQTKGFILGAVLGVGAGLLFAPYRGVTMRKKVASKLNAVTDYVKNMNESMLKSTLKNIVLNQATDDQIDQIYNELMGTNTYENNMKKFADK